MPSATYFTLKTVCRLGSSERAITVGVGEEVTGASVGTAEAGPADSSFLGLEVDLADTTGTVAFGDWVNVAAGGVAGAASGCAALAICCSDESCPAEFCAAVAAGSLCGA